ncbi:hypothetical protein DPMN_014123 [Dreissena polymorpha]|uniref:Uncharacterized protein n=1 Tax=Dreissena polymorpha TaxID=45954 RepID=A0A9D4S2E8_DREPO|nr:hypothetical protein DPMN_014123 [Dreissena polymorpha]
MDSADDIDVDAVMKSMDVEITKRASASHESSSFDDAEEWEKVRLCFEFEPRSVKRGL